MPPMAVIAHKRDRLVVQEATSAMREHAELGLGRGELFEASAVGAHAEAVRRVIAEGSPAELPILRVGAEKWVHVRLTPVERGTEVERGAALWVTDVSRVGRAIEDARVSVAQNRETLKRYIGTLTHDLREPARCLVSFSEYLVGQFEAGLKNRDKAKEIAGRLLRRSEQLVEMLEQLRRFVGVSIGLAEQVELWPATKVVSSALEALARRVEHERADVQQVVSASAFVPAPISLVLQNLVDNALKYSDAPASVVISCHDVGADVVFVVSDEGIGFEPGEAADIFGFFRQLHPHAERSQGGMGMGLAIAKEIVEQCGGNIWAESEGSGKGATFHIVIPASAPTSRHAKDHPPR